MDIANMLALLTLAHGDADRAYDLLFDSIPRRPAADPNDEYEDACEAAERHYADADEIHYRATRI